MAERLDLDTLLAEPHGSRVGGLMRRIGQGAVFVYPTETIYGLGGVMIPSVRERIYDLKDRPSTLPLIAIAASKDHFFSYNPVFTTAARLLADAFWPGNVTLIVKADFPGGTLAIRVTDHPFVGLVNRFVRQPLYSTSANRSGEPYRDDPDAIFAAFSSGIDFMVESRTPSPAKPSTIVDVTREDSWRVVREGVISAHRIHALMAMPFGNLPDEPPQRFPRAKTSPDSPVTNTGSDTDPQFLSPGNR